MILSLLLSLVLNSQVSWDDPVTGETYCGTLATIDFRGYAWILPDRNKQFYAFIPYEKVKEGCPNG